MKSADGGNAIETQGRHSKMYKKKKKKPKSGFTFSP